MEHGLSEGYEDDGLEGRSSKVWSGVVARINELFKDNQ